MKIDISVELEEVLDELPRPQVQSLVQQTLIKVEVARVRISRTSVEVRNHEQIFGKNNGLEVRAVDDALEELCGKLRPEYPRWKFLGDFLGSCPRQVKPCLAALDAKIALLQLIKRKVEEDIG
jgi:hypothetical protein